MPSENNNKRQRSDDGDDDNVNVPSLPSVMVEEGGGAPAAAATAASSSAVMQLKILPREQWKKDGNYRLLCKIDGCTTRGRTEKDDMCKKHYTMFMNAWRDTGGRSQKERKQSMKRIKTTKT